VADEHGAFNTNGVEHSNHIRDEMPHAIWFGARWRVTLSNAAQVQSDRVISSISQRRKLVPPRVPQIRHPMHEQHEWPLSGFGDMQCDFACRDSAVL
jgi:hypothetical protein